ncbi:hypothetical protein Hanom_Chr14g01253211 [Helianthus anomalus]
MVGAQVLMGFLYKKEILKMMNMFQIMVKRVKGVRGFHGKERKICFRVIAIHR